MIVKGCKLIAYNTTTSTEVIVKSNSKSDTTRRSAILLVLKFPITVRERTKTGILLS